MTCTEDGYAYNLTDWQTALILLQECIMSKIKKVI
jgi:hypothetical protein